MPSIKGSSQFKAIRGITLYGSIGPTGNIGPRGTALTGPTGATASVYLTNITSPNFNIINYFLDGTTFGVSGSLIGITGDTLVYLDGITLSGGTASILVGASAIERSIEIKKIKGSTGFRAYVGITTNNELVTINVQRYDGEYTLSSGDVTQLVKIVGGNLFGTTAAKYGNVTNQIDILKANVFEKTRGVYPLAGSIDWTHIIGSQLTINLHPYTLVKNDSDRNSKAKIYAIDLNSFSSSTLTKIIIDKPPTKPIGFSVYIQGGLMTEEYSFPIFSCPEGSGGSVIFPFNKQPCFRTDEAFLIHFISANDTWYGYIFGKSNGFGNYFCTDAPQLSNYTSNVYYFYQGLTGSCCKTDGTCEEIMQGLCDGFFAGVGTTCGLSGDNCTQNIGSCCIKTITDGKQSIQCIENISSFDCLNLNNDTVEAVFNGFNKTCIDLNCDDCFKNLGGCCNGKGLCTPQTEIDCIRSGGSFLGKGVLCYVDNKTPICSSGTGACCSITGSCTITTASTCFNANGNYFGDGTTCSGITCSNQLSCCSYLPYKLKPGDLFGGGIIVGIFNPKTSMVLGASNSFSRRGITSSFINGGETLAQYYQNEYDYIGYGITGENCYGIQDNTDSYYIISSLYPVSIDKNKKLINPISDSYETQEFIWYGSGIAWGPLTNLTKYSYNDFTFLNKTYEKYYLAYGEGYYGITGDSLDNIKNDTFQTCYSSRSNGLDPIARLFTRNPKNANGLWNRSWGLYNTIRMIAADNADYLNLSSKPYFTSDEFESGDEIHSIRALKLFDNLNYENSFGLTANPEQLTDWYLPSHDELAFIAANCVNNSPYGFNLNSELLVNNGVPYSGWHWSSTGSFDTTNKIEGVFTSGKPEHGTVAWAINFDVNGELSNFTVKKENRNTKLKVRPIRAIRCDGVVPNSSSDQYKLWKTPNLLRNRI